MSFSKYKVWLLSLLLLVNTFSACSQSKETKPTKVFILAGQSNMDGRARAHNLTLEDRQRLNKVAHRITFYYNHNKPVPLSVTKANNYLKKKFEADSLFGPELFFGINLAEQYPDEKFIFIKRAKGGMSLYGAWNPNWDSTKAAHMNESEQPKLYSDLINYVKEVLAGLPENSYKLEGMLWVQGETDAGVKKWGTTPAEEYEVNLIKLITGVRTELNCPKLPFMIFQVGHGKVVQGMKNIAKNDLNTGLILQNKDAESDDFYERNPLPLGHYTAKSMKKIGTSFFDLYERQFAMRDILCNNGGPTDPSLYPELNWLLEANERIEKYRKGDFSIKVIDDDGKPVNGAEVELELISHDFYFGGVISAKNFLGENSDLYKKIFLENFNKGGFENSLKYKGKEFRAPMAEKLIPWFQENKIPIRGHCLIWPRWDHMHKEALKFSIDSTGLRSYCNNQVKEYAQKWDVVEWDVVNEPHTNHTVQDKLGEEVLVDWFKIAKTNAKNPNCRMFLNEFKVITSPTNNPKYATKKIEHYESQVSLLQKHNAPIDGLGFQSRVRFFIPPDTIYQRLNRMSNFGLPMLGTEFEVKDSKEAKFTEEDRARITREMMTIYFSHPQVEGIFAWSLFSDEKEHALYRLDGTPRLQGKVWNNLVNDEWHTQLTSKTNSNGDLTFRGFNGYYKCTIRHKGKILEREIKFNKGTKELQIKLN